MKVVFCCRLKICVEGKLCTWPNEEFLMISSSQMGPIDKLGEMDPNVKVLVKLVPVIILIKTGSNLSPADVSEVGGGGSEDGGGDGAEVRVAGLLSLPELLLVARTLRGSGGAEHRGGGREHGGREREDDEEGEAEVGEQREQGEQGACVCYPAHGHAENEGMGEEQWGVDP
jgi:hypothetical protein